MNLRSISIMTITAGLLTASAVAAAAQDGSAPTEQSEWVEGTSRIANYTDFGVTTVLDETKHLEQLRGRTYEGVVEASDPRVAGSSTGTLNQDTHVLPPDWVFPAVTLWGTERIENDGGAWECTYSGGDMAFGLTQTVSWCTGVDGYEGYAMRMISTKELETGGNDWRALLWPGDLPPLPEPVPAP